MDILKNCAQIYNKYVNYNYTFVLDCEISFVVSFHAEHFHHLVCLKYLTDTVQVTKRKDYPTSVIYKKILKGKIPQSIIEKSEFFTKIHERLLYFCNFDEIISSKLIIDFDYTKVPSTDLLSKYLLYKQYEDGYAILGLKYDIQKGLYVPETFFFEKSDYYIKDQISYNVADLIPMHYKSTTKKDLSLC